MIINIILPYHPSNFNSILLFIYFTYTHINDRSCLGVKNNEDILKVSNDDMNIISLCLALRFKNVKIKYNLTIKIGQIE